MQIQVNATIHATDIVEGLDYDYENAMLLIAAIDKNMGDTEFTEMVVTYLVKGMAADYDNQDIRNFLKQLRKEFK